MLSTKKPAQIPVFIAFFPLTTISTAKSGLKNICYAHYFFLIFLLSNALILSAQDECSTAFTMESKRNPTAAYLDNDPTVLNVDPSNTDANKGIVNTAYEPFNDLLIKMSDVNFNVYNIIEYFDKR